MYSSSPSESLLGWFMRETSLRQEHAASTPAVPESYCVFVFVWWEGMLSATAQPKYGHKQPSLPLHLLKQQESISLLVPSQVHTPS